MLIGCGGRSQKEMEEVKIWVNSKTGCLSLHMCCDMHSSYVGKHLHLNNAVNQDSNVI